MCHGQLERERQLVLFLVFEHLEEDLAGYLNRVGEHGMSPRTIQVRQYIVRLNDDVHQSNRATHFIAFSRTHIEICKRANDWRRLFTYTSNHPS